MLSYIIGYLQSDSPSGAELNALEIYLLVSLFFIMATMFEFAIVLILKRKQETQIRHQSGSDVRMQNHRNITDAIDFGALLGFMFFYIMFNCIYMIEYTY